MATTFRIPKEYDFRQMPELSDEELVELVSEGESSAAEILLKRYAGMVRSLSAKYFLQGAEKEDIVQEGQIGLLEAIHGYSAQKQCSFRSFAHLCVTRQIITAVKAYSRQKNIPLNSSLSLQSVVDTEEESGQTLEIEDVSYPTPEEQLISRELLFGLYQFINSTCSELEKDVFLRFLDGKTYQEISEACGRSVKSIDGTLQRVRRKLAQHLAEELEKDWAL